MTHSPTPEELAALKVANAALLTADSSYDFASAIVFALGSAQLLQSPESAAELARLRDRLTGGPETDDETRQLDLLALMPERSAAVVSGHLARLLGELSRLRARVAELETSARGCDGEGCVLPHSSWCTRAREFAAQHSGCTCGEPWKDTPQTHAGHCWLLSPPDDELEWHRNRVAELLARVAELEAANSSLIANRDAQIVEWLGKKSREYGTSNAEKRAKTEAVARMADKLSRGAVRQPVEDPHDSPLHHDYKTGRDLPERPSV